MKYAAIAIWLGLVSLGGVTAGNHQRVEAIPAYSARVEDIPMQIVRAAISHGISPSRALARAWNESRYQDVDSACCRGVFQLHKRYFPQMPLGQHIDVATAHLAGLIRKHGARAETVYRVGH